MLGAKSFMLQLSDFSKSFGHKALFKNVSIEFHPKKIYYIYGENGIGKTTLFRCILGQEKFDGSICSDTSSQFCIFDDTPFFLNLTGLENIVFFTKNLSVQKQIDTLNMQYLPRELLCKSKVRTYSLGERKMLALLLVRLLNPDIILFDEVLNGLDQSNRRILFKTLEVLREQGTLIIMSGHEQLYLELCDEALWVNNKTIETVSIQRIQSSFATAEKEGDSFVD